jgi:hypothetical protein
MRHVAQKLAPTSVGQLDRLPGTRVLLDTIPQTENCLIDLRLQGIHFSTVMNLVKFTSIAAAEI